MKRNVLVYIHDILESINRIQEYTKDTHENQLAHDYQKQDALFRRFEVIGEAVSQMPQEFKDMHKEYLGKISWV